jgi:hypothetical protein
VGGRAVLARRHPGHRDGDDLLGLARQVTAVEHAAVAGRERAEHVGSAAHQLEHVGDEAAEAVAELVVQLGDLAGGVGFADDLDPSRDVGHGLREYLQDSSCQLVS